MDARWLVGGGTIYRGPFAGEASGISAEYSRRENYLTAAICQPAHGCGFARRADPFVVSKQRAGPALFAADRRRAHRGCALLQLVLCFDSARCGGEVFRGGEQLLARADTSAGTLERKITILLGGAGRRARADVVFAGLPATVLDVWHAAAA